MLEALLSHARQPCTTRLAASLPHGRPGAQVLCMDSPVIRASPAQLREAPWSRSLLDGGQVLERGERLELLVDKTDHLQSEALVFKRQSRQLKNKLWWRNVRLLALILGIVVIAAYVVAAIACGPLMRKC